jgi:hypothetical protein
MEKSYSTLFNGVTSTINTMELCLRELKMYQQIAEEKYLEEHENDDEDQEERYYITRTPSELQKLQENI